MNNLQKPPFDPNFRFPDFTQRAQLLRPENRQLLAVGLADLLAAIERFERLDAYGEISLRGRLQEGAFKTVSCGSDHTRKLGPALERGDLPPTQ